MPVPEFARLFSWREMDSNFRFRARMATVFKPSYFVYLPETDRVLPKDRSPQPDVASDELSDADDSPIESPDADESG